MFSRVGLNEERARANTSIWIIWRKNKNSTPVVRLIWITASDSSLADIHYPLAQATWFDGLNLTRIFLKFNDLPTRLTLSELEKQLFSRDFRLSRAKRPKKPLVKTSKGKLIWILTTPSFVFFLCSINNANGHDCLSSGNNHHNFTFYTQHCGIQQKMPTFVKHLIENQTQINNINPPSNYIWVHCYS